MLPFLANRKTLPILLACLILRVFVAKAQPVLNVEPFVSGFNLPVKVTHAGDARLFVAEMGGHIRIVKNGAILPVPFLDISDKINEPTYSGIYSIAFHPQFQDNGYFYVMYCKKSEAAFQVSRFNQSSSDADLANSSELPIVTIPYSNSGGHRGGDLAFGKDGMLYISTGDNGPGSRGDAGDPDNNSQNPGLLFGKMLRIDPLTSSPSDNFTSNIWALGLRNPWRFSFDRQTGDLWLGDNGQDGWEEINYREYPFDNTVLNFGWSCLEGSQTYNPDHCNPGTTYTPPRVVYPGFTNNGGKSASVQGGYVYRGQNYPSLKGCYIFGDYSSGKIGYVNKDGSTGFYPDLSYPSIISFGEDQNGELYILSMQNGTLSKLAGSADPLPVKLKSFSAKVENCQVLLRWSAAEDSNFSHFEIERLQGNTYHKIADTKRNSDHSYTWVDKTPTAGTNIYRLKMVDRDHSYAYSRGISVAVACREISVFPNPASAHVIIRGSAAGDKVRLFSVTGELVRSETVISSDHHLDIHHLPAGTYELELTNIGLAWKSKVIRE
ncbi:hypothetical protein DYBT9275_04072 [Dyadobacter sp. CECT 9275]|uniref:T9SS type A sorting domain-containing protein n=1 Tax=Dyadobacter helix TaxID=2822344 RepID=A0A916JF95_9BACT|nr:PQQ-dependent sugar dehydrogenase [Dyadobacter sp. CECT 9275]CAG5007553.1 hypothetical protein DYBT9275_04072 [Dyadobacter sp. CECT 9275]